MKFLLLEFHTVKYLKFQLTCAMLGLSLEHGLSMEHRFFFLILSTRLDLFFFIHLLLSENKSTQKEILIIFCPNNGTSMIYDYSYTSKLIDKKKQIRQMYVVQFLLIIFSRAYELSNVFHKHRILFCPTNKNKTRKRFFVKHK